MNICQQGAEIFNKTCSFVVSIGFIFPFVLSYELILVTTTFLDSILSGPLNCILVKTTYILCFILPEL